MGSPVRSGICALVLAGAVVACVIFAAKTLPYRYRRSELVRDSVRAFLGLSNYFFIMGATDFVIYSLDRTILASFRSTAIRSRCSIQDVSSGFWPIAFSMASCARSACPS